ncbi:dicarboxylate/amino acid:cation symporter [Lysobacteraceae bacterium NML07-0707]|nr:dicarboxylate/amino acid:cation symporter [Xanthomonadaceae bacterium NML07-0707]
MSDARSKNKGLPLHWKMLIGFIGGTLLGLCANFFAADTQWLATITTYVADPIGQLFLRLLFMLVVPLVFSALILGVVEIGDPKSLGRIGGRTLFWVATVTTLAVSIGLVAVNLVKPGTGLSAEQRAKLMEEAGKHSDRVASATEAAHNLSGLDVLLNIVPRNPIAAAANNDLIAVMFFALMFGIAATLIRNRATEHFVLACQGVYDICLKLIDWVIRLAPYAVAAMLFSVTAKLGLDVLLLLAKFVATAVGAMGVHFALVFPLLVWLAARRSPLQFLRGAQPAIVTAFSTSSSSATLPTTLMCAEERLGVPRRVSRFVCTLGATANMNGTAMFEGIAVLFLAQFYNVELSLAQQVMVLGLCVVGGIGAAGVPGGSLPVIASILLMFGIPAEGLAFILGVDRLLDMCRTTVNVTGDLVLSTVVARGEPAEAEGTADIEAGERELPAH